jgi:hypothetical protein
MKWNPTGPAFEVYERLVTEKQDKVIEVEYGYGAYNGPVIRFGFNYSGTEITYGADMEIDIALSCRLAANSSTTRNSMSIDQTDGTFKDKGKDALETLNAVNEGYTDARKPIWTPCAEKDAKDVKIKKVQFKDQTNGSVNLNAQKELGNKILLSNIGSDGQQIIWSPYTWEAEQGCGGVLMPEKEPDPMKRYGYIVGPGIITSFTRKMEYAPPTQDKTGTAGGNKAPPQTKKPTPAPATTTTGMTQEEKDSQKPNEKSTQNASSPSNTNGIQYGENPNGPQKQKLLNEEQGVEMNATIFMCPAVTGIKPEDIIFVPSLKGDRIEDYKVSSVSYAQSGGVVSVTVKGSRTYSLSQPMYPEASEPFLEKAKTLTTLKAWEKFAWQERLGLPGAG